MRKQRCAHGQWASLYGTTTLRLEPWFSSPRDGPDYELLIFDDAGDVIIPQAILRRSVTVRVVEDVDDVVLSAAEAKALVAGDPDVLRRVQLQTEIVKMEALRAAHLDQQIQARWELKRLPQRIADLRARVKAIAADVAFRDIHTPQPNAQGDKPFSFVVDGRAYTDRVEAAPALAAAVERGTEASFTAGQATGSTPSTPIAAYRGFQVTVRPAGSGTIRLGLRCPDRSDALEYATARTLDVAQVPAYGIGLFQRLDNLLDARRRAQGSPGWSRPRRNQPGQLHRPARQTIRPRRSTAFCTARPGAHRPQAHPP